MTEAEWRTSGDPVAMAAVVLESPRATDRTCRLYVAAFWEWQAGNLDDRSRLDLLRRVAAMEQLAETGRLPRGRRFSRSEFDIFFNREARSSLTQTVRASANWREHAPVATAAQPPLLRCVFGNPLRPVAADPAWRTSTVSALAAGIYEERAFDRLPILADALQDAGCENADVLEHCRGDGVHARGCWVVDLVLGKA